MDKEKVKEILSKQLELLAERSADGSIYSYSQLPAYTEAMLEIAKFLKISSF